MVRELEEDVKILAIFLNQYSGGVIVDGIGKSIKEEIHSGDVVSTDMFWSREQTPGPGFWVWEGRADRFDEQWEFIFGQWRKLKLSEWRHIIETNALEFPLTKQ